MNTIINLLRISRDSKYIEMFIQAPTDYEFKELLIQKLPSDGKFSNTWKDASNLVANKDSVTIKISTGIFDSTGSYPMYKFKISLAWIGSGTEPGIDGSKISDQYDIAFISDINNVYSYILSLILDLDCKCLEPSNELFRMFSFLYAHQEAMRLGRYDDAVDLYKIIFKNLRKCGYLDRADNVGCVTNNCGCNE